MLEPDCEAGADIILSSEEGDTTDQMLLQPLSKFKVQHGSELVAEDFQQVPLSTLSLIFRNISAEIFKKKTYRIFELQSMSSIKPI